MPAFKPVIIITTAANREEAEKIGRALLEGRLAACVQYQDIISEYVWQGEYCRSAEVRIVIKSARCHYSAVEKTILANSGYDCPQILMQPIQRGLRAYLRWMKAQLGL
ncbi:MAG: divalent-cation tolerance protein CutA [Neisseria sp.]|nr:divalent-cation tolerance protein CutA [Neisseria sp.]